MATADPHAFEDFGPIDAAFLAQLPADTREALASAEARHVAGVTQLVPHVEIEAIVERQRLAAMKAG